MLSLGLARYVFVAAGRVLPWLYGDPAAPAVGQGGRGGIVGVVLTVAAAGVLPEAVTLALLVVAVALLAESFGRSVWALWRRAGGRPFPRAAVTAALSLALVWAALLVPDQLDDLTPGAFLRIPVEGLVFVASCWCCRPGAARVCALLVGLGLAVLTILRLLDMGFLLAFDAPFHPGLRRRPTPARRWGCWTTRSAGRALSPSSSGPARSSSRC